MNEKRFCIVLLRRAGPQRDAVERRLAASLGLSLGAFHASLERWHMRQRL